MGFFKKIFKPVSKVLDKIIPNEIKPALPYLAALAPVFAPAGMQGLIGSTMGRRALTSGLLNIGGQLAQEGSEGDINLLSAGLGALTGAMTAPGAADKFTSMTTKGSFAGAPDAITGGQKAIDAAMQNRTLLTQAKDFGLEGLAKGSEMFAAGAADPFSMAGAKAATLPAATATGDVMEASARQLEKQNAINEALSAAELLADSGARGDAIRNAMLAYGFFSDEEIEDTIASAGYKAGGRVGFKFGGIDEAIETVQEETIKDGQKGIMMAAKEDPLLVEEYNKYVFDLMEQKPNAKPMSFSDFKRMIMSGMKDGGIMNAKRGLVDEPGGYAGEYITKKNKYITKKDDDDDDDDGPSWITKKKKFDLSDLDSLKDDDEDEDNDGIEWIKKKDSSGSNKWIQKKAEGGLMNLGGKEMDLRGGGFVPIGKKERADDVPARLSKNEFVMTADAVRAAGGGSVNKGAKRMYDVMNKLEARA